ncbi:MAG TPA: cytochrome c oxidase subunit II [Longimicrobiales bacterium]
MSAPTRRAPALTLAAILCVAALAGCAGEYPQTTFRPVTDFGIRLNDVLAHAFWWMLGILALVEILLIYVTVRFRERPGREAPRQVYGHGALEVVWTLIPAVIVTAIAIPTVRTIFDVNAPPPADALVVDVIGHQWWWEFRYPQYDIVTANELHLPVGRPIHLRLSSADVVHSFWVPQLGGKRDTNPITVAAREDGDGVNHLMFTIFEPGAYSGQCAEYCGSSHALMRMRVVAQPAEEFEGWVRDMKTPVTPPPGSLAARGKEIFMRSACMACHTIEGTNARGVVGPNLTGLGARWAIGAGLLENTPENLATWIRDPQRVKPGALMPGTEARPGGLPPTGLSDDEVEAVVAYLESLGTPSSMSATDSVPPSSQGN